MVVNRRQSCQILPVFLIQDTACVLQFISTLEANIFSEINALTNVTITKVVAGSISVTNSISFTAAYLSAAVAGQSALATLLSSGINTVFGRTFGSVSVSNITQTNTTNPGE